MTKRLIIGLNGLPRAGKDTIADYLVNKHCFNKIAFADALKQELAYAFDVPASMFNEGEKNLPRHELALVNCRDLLFVGRFADPDNSASYHIPRSPRWLMQRWGTEYRRSQDSRYWIDIVQDFIDTHPCDNIVISDARYTDEVDMILHHQPAEMWRITRPENEQADNHSSNAELPDELVDREVFNTHSVESLLLMVNRVLGDAVESKCGVTT